MLNSEDIKLVSMVIVRISLRIIWSIIVHAIALSRPEMLAH